MGLSIRDVDALDRLAVGLSRFGETGEAALLAAERELDRKIAWIQQRVEHWQRETQRARTTYEAAAAALKRCESQPPVRDRDGNLHRPDCSGPAATARQAQALLRQMEAKLEMAQQWRARIGQAASVFRQRAARAHRLCGEHTLRATAMLANSAAGYRRVQAIQSSLVGTGNNPGNSASGGLTPAESWATQSLMGEIALTGTRATTKALSTGASSTTDDLYTLLGNGHGLPDFHALPTRLTLPEGMVSLSSKLWQDSMSADPMEEPLESGGAIIRDAKGQLQFRQSNNHSDRSIVSNAEDLRPGEQYVGFVHTHPYFARDMSSTFSWDDLRKFAVDDPRASLLIVRSGNESFFALVRTNDFDSRLNTAIGGPEAYVAEMKVAWDSMAEARKLIQIDSPQAWFDAELDSVRKLCRDHGLGHYTGNLATSELTLDQLEP